MIITTFLTMLVTAFNTLFSFLGHVSELPFGAETSVHDAFGAFFGFKAIFWPLDIVWTCFVAYIGIQVTLKVLRLVRVIR